MDNRRHNRGFFDPKLCCRWLIKLKAAAGAPQGLGLELDQPTADHRGSWQPTRDNVYGNNN